MQTPQHPFVAPYSAKIFCSPVFTFGFVCVFAWPTNNVPRRCSLSAYYVQWCVLFEVWQEQPRMTPGWTILGDFVHLFNHGGNPPRHASYHAYTRRKRATTGVRDTIQNWAQKRKHLDACYHKRFTRQFLSHRLKQDKKRAAKTVKNAKSWKFDTGGTSDSTYTHRRRKTPRIKTIPILSQRESSEINMAPFHKNYKKKVTLGNTAPGRPWSPPAGSRTPRRRWVAPCAAHHRVQRCGCEKIKEPPFIRRKRFSRHLEERGRGGREKGNGSRCWWCPAIPAMASSQFLLFNPLFARVL